MRNRTWHRVGTLNLKIFLSISLGAHLLALSILTFLFPGFKIDRILPLHVEVSLLPLMVEEKLTEVKIKKEEKRLLRNEKKETPIHKKELNSEPPPPFETLATVIPLEEPKPLSQHQPEEKPLIEEKPLSIPILTSQLKAQIKKEETRLQREIKEEEPVITRSPQLLIPVKPEENAAPTSDHPPALFEDKKPEIGSTKEERAITEPIAQAMSIALPLDSALNFEREKNSASFIEDPPKRENLSITMPNPKEARSTSHPNTEPSEEPHNFVKLQPPPHGEVIFAQPRYAENPKPVYPQEARRRGYEGEVLLRVEVLANGRVGRLEVKKSSGYKILDRSALTAVKQWKFIPANEGNGTIPCWVNIPIKFQLQ